MKGEVSRGGSGACQHPYVSSLYIALCIYIHKSKAWVYRAPSEVTRNSHNLELLDCYHRICRQILPKNAGLTFPLAQNLEFQFLGVN